MGASVILIGHDMGLMAQFVDRIGSCMPVGWLELGPVQRDFHRPAAPLHADADHQPASAEAEGVFQRHPRLAPLLDLPPAVSSTPLPTMSWIAVS